MRISDWSSDVCSSDLADEHQPRSPIEQPLPVRGRQPAGELRAPQRIDALPAEFDGDEARYQYAQLHRKGPAGIDELRKQRGREDDELGIAEAGEKSRAIERPQRPRPPGAHPACFTHRPAPGPDTPPDQLRTARLSTAIRADRQERDIKG